MSRRPARITQTWPIIDGKVHPDVSQAIRFLRDDIGKLHARVAGLDESKVSSAELPAQLTKHAKVVRSLLQANGPAPLNANSLYGSLAQPQITNVPTVGSLPLINDPLSKNGVLIVQGGNLYRFDGPTRTWIAV